MRLTPKKIEDILLAILGEEGLPLIRELIGKSNISEFDLATRTKKDIKVIRKQLYILYNHNLISFTRKKDKQKGWYIYYWTLIPENVRFNYIKRNKNLLERLKNQVEIEKKELFFVCPGKCVRLNFDQATDFEFHCPECGQLIHEDNREEQVTKLEERIKAVELLLEEAKKEKKQKKTAGKMRKKENVAKKKSIPKKVNTSGKKKKMGNKEKDDKPVVQKAKKVKKI